MKNELLVWDVPIRMTEIASKNKLPLSSSGEIGISERFNPKNTHPNFDFPWVRLSATKNIQKLPQHVFICLKGHKQVNFDYVNYGNFFIVSEALYKFLKINGFDYEDDKCNAFIVDTKGNQITKEVFYFLRVFSWQIKSELVQIKYSNNGEPLSLVSCDEVGNKKIFMSNIEGLRNLLLINADLKNYIETNFRNTMLFDIKTWYELNKSVYFWE
ncbi:Imm43 family immunity protein [Taylorella equigenitalis]|uniref:Immunity protein 43 domain-containing protein n=1 Tax=Taylorella equigenitalis ATCC 35865 TaxID=743973 RepID=A0ABM5NB85_9BURK|nr:hypothetical protein [Taylorella equigenitalis]AFN36065.1 hypothetical protein KUI_0996 [Taylorella equigenitalis ATCC 35865]ASY30699.1 hypothetical protein B9Z30_04865 [Taylorella equigenitalis]ASY39479.1 hypothetical protein CA604_05000 [Taylorella equigenitalis]KOS59327.1 hypothetical protein AM589_00035 [Taylorella equigenitalis]WDU47376.1 hypothetical protein KNO30_04830 [Taylorella equigenitalis]